VAVLGTDVDMTMTVTATPSADTSAIVSLLQSDAMAVAMEQAVAEEVVQEEMASSDSGLGTDITVGAGEKMMISFVEETQADGTVTEKMVVSVVSEADADAAVQELAALNSALETYQKELAAVQAENARLTAEAEEEEEKSSNGSVKDTVMRSVANIDDTAEVFGLETGTFVGIVCGAFLLGVVCMITLWRRSGSNSTKIAHRASESWPNTPDGRASIDMANYGQDGRSSVGSLQNEYAVDYQNDANWEQPSSFDGALQAQAKAVKNPSTPPLTAPSKPQKEMVFSAPKGAKGKGKSHKGEGKGKERSAFSPSRNTQVDNSSNYSQ
jgi:hypothetical protein